MSILLLMLILMPSPVCDVTVTTPGVVGVVAVVWVVAVVGVDGVVLFSL